MDTLSIHQLSASSGEFVEPPKSSKPITASGFELCPGFIATVQEQSFSGFEHENPYCQTWGSGTAHRPGVRDSAWMYLTSFCNYPNRRRTSCSTRKLPDRIAEGLQLYSARTFHITLSPRVYKGGHGPPQNTTTPKAIQATTQDVGYYAPRGPILYKSLCSVYHRVLELVDPLPTILQLRVSLSRLGG